MASYKAPDTVNQLMAVCHDAEELYGYAADRVDGSDLRPLLRAAAGLHREIGDALQPYVNGASGSFTAAGTLAGKFRQLRGRLRATFAAQPEAALLPELEDAEQAVVQAFEGALAGPIDSGARTLVTARLELLKATQDRIANVARCTVQ
jgi:uncharacterized protein (TIGR02284 family)